MRLFGKKNTGSTSHIWWPFGGFSGSRFIGSDRKRYELLSVLGAVVNKRAECFGNAVPYVLDDGNNEPDNLTFNRVRGLLESPNALMSFQQLYRATEVYRMIYGYGIWFTPRAYQGAIPSALLPLPPDKVSIEVDPSYSILTNQLPSVRVRVDGRLTNLSLDDLIIFNDIKTGFGSHPLLAQPRMTALRNELDLLSDIAQAQSSIVRNRGALGVLARDPRDEIPVGTFEDSREELQEAYKQYGLSPDQWKVIITSASLRWIPLSMNIGDLKLIELEQEAAKKVCGVYDVPYELLPLSGNSTFENRKQAKVELYQDYVVPTSTGDADLITRKLNVKGLRVMFDYTHLPVFQEDQAAKAETISSLSGSVVNLTSSNIITATEARRLLSDYIDIDPTWVKQ